MASETENAITVLEAELKLRDARESAWESEAQPTWFVSALVHLGEYAAALSADRAGGLLTERGIAERAASHRDPVVRLTERFGAQARDRRAAVADTEATAWQEELARPRGVS